MTTAAEKVALAVHRAWNCYRRGTDVEAELEEELAEEAWEVLGLFPHLSCAQAAFVVLVAEIISGRSAAEGRKAEAEAEAAVAEVFGRIEPELAPRAGFEEELLERLVALCRERGWQRGECRAL